MNTEQLKSYLQQQAGLNENESLLFITNMDCTHIKDLSNSNIARICDILSLNTEEIVNLTRHIVQLQIVVFHVFDDEINDDYDNNNNSNNDNDDNNDNNNNKDEDSDETDYDQYPTPSPIILANSESESQIDIDDTSIEMKFTFSNFD